MSDRFTEKAENALNRSVKIAEKFGHTYIGSEHLLLSLAEDELCCAALILKKSGIDKKKITSIIKDYSGTGVKSKLSSKELLKTEDMRQLTIEVCETLCFKI